MILVPSVLWKQHYIFSSQKTADDLRAGIEKTLSEGRNLCGAFYSPYAFELTSVYHQLTSVEADMPAGSLTQLYGEIIIWEGRTLVRFTVRPHRILPFLFLLMPLVTIGIIVGTGNIQTDTPAIIAQSIFFIGIPLFCLLASLFLKRAVRKRFIKAFKLQTFPAAA